VQSGRQGGITMASIRKEILVDNTPERVWDALRDVGNVHERVAPGFVVATRMEEGARVVTFGNGMNARELIVDVDDDARRVVWAVVGSPRLTHHNASIQVFPEGKGCRVVWIADLLPNELKGDIAAMIEQGMRVMKPTLDRA
jgi:carbon monoxide dehydrogenase subunit G